MAAGTKAPKTSTGGTNTAAVAQTAPVSAPPAQKVVGPNVMGTKEEYQLIRRLQSALFGGVYEAKGLRTGKDFAIKVLHKSELTKAQETNSIEFCEVPLSEIKFAELMRGNDNVMEPEEHFEDQYCFYVVFDLCRGGDLLEALKQKPHGFDELQAQALIKQATKGLAYLHSRRVAMQDVSLENMLLHVEEMSGNYKVKVCDPGQAAIFDLDSAGDELQVDFRGLVGKSFRPPELHKQRPYFATKVDSWCLGWSTFYLLTAQPLFMSADPAQQDADWQLFQQGDYTTLFQQKSNLCSHTGLDFIFRLMQLEPTRRMSIADALDHAWLTDTKICPVLAPQEFWPESLLKKARASVGGATMTETVATAPIHRVADGMASAEVSDAAVLAMPVAPPSSASMPPGIHALATAVGATAVAARPSGSISWGAPSAGDVPTWATAAGATVGAQALRVQSPARSPRAAAPPGALQFDQRRSRGRQVQLQGAAARLPYVVATAHSPAPVGASPVSPSHRVLSAANIRACSPLQGQPQQALALQGAIVGGQLRPQAIQAVHSGSTDTQAYQQPAYTTPRMASRPRSPGVPAPVKAAVNMDNSQRLEAAKQPAWAFRAERPSAGDEGASATANAVGPMGTQDRQGRPIFRAPSPSGTMPHIVSATAMPNGQVRYVQSPTRTQGAVYVQQRSQSPVQLAASTLPAVRATHSQIRTASPVGAVARPAGAVGGISWTQVPAAFSPRHGNSPAISRAASPISHPVAPGVAGMPGTAMVPPGAVPAPIGFSFTPDLPSPGLEKRTMSPAPTGAIAFPKRMPVTNAVRGAPSVMIRR